MNGDTSAGRDEQGLALFAALWKKCKAANGLISICSFKEVIFGYSRLVIGIDQSDLTENIEDAN